MKKYFLLAIASAVFSLSQAQYAWVNKNLLPDSGRLAPGCFTINGKGYIVGGGLKSIGGTPMQSEQTWQYDPSNDSWLRKADYPRTLIPGAYFSANGKGYIIGGGDSSGHYFSDCNEYDPLGNTWTPKTSFPENGLGGGFQFVINGIAYIGAGARNNNVHGVVSSYSYDPAHDTWNSIANYPMPAMSLVCFTIDSFGYAGLGGDGNNNFYDNMFRYDPAHDTWSPIASFPAKKRFANFSSFNIGGKGYVAGGTTNLNGSSSISYSLGDCYAYNPVTDTWESAPGFKGPARSGATPLIFTDSIFMIGGGNVDGDEKYRLVDEFKNIGVQCISSDTTHTTVYDTTHVTVTDTLFIVVKTGLTAPNDFNTLMVYPNPAKTYLVINTGNYANLPNHLIKISNTLGQTVFSTGINQQLYNLNLSTWTGSGTYFLQIIDNIGAVVAVKEIVLQ